MAPSGRGVKRVGPGEFRCGRALGRRPPLPFNERRPGGRSARQHPPAQLAGRRLGAQHAVARWPVRIVPRTAAVRRYRRSDTIALKHNMLALRTLALVGHPEPENRRAPQTEATPLATPPAPPSDAGAWSGHARGNATPRPPAARRSSPPGRALAALVGRPAPSTRPARPPGEGGGAASATRWCRRSSSPCAGPCRRRGRSRTPRRSAPPRCGQLVELGAEHVDALPAGDQAAGRDREAPAIRQPFAVVSQALAGGRIRGGMSCAVASRVPSARRPGAPPAPTSPTRRRPPRPRCRRRRRRSRERPAARR